MKARIKALNDRIKRLTDMKHNSNGKAVIILHKIAEQRMYELSELEGYKSTGFGCEAN